MYNASVSQGLLIDASSGDGGRMTQRQIIQLFFAADDSDSQVAELSVLQMAQRQISLERGDIPARQRRQLPPRRHLRV